jgi:two-component system response regulator HydG
LESELFGVMRGAFTGADRDRIGVFESAHRGTVFLDEIGELDAGFQVKLLRFLQERTIRPVGAPREKPVDVRIVAATNQELETAVAEGRFRSDLYHRLTQITLRVPPLRKRIEDIAPLAEHFLAQHDPSLRFTPAAIDVLLRHSWPGNIRELRNVVMRAAVLSLEDEIGPEDLPLNQSADLELGAVTVASSSLEGMERKMIFEALHSTNGHQQKAAAKLGISRRTLSRKLKVYDSGLTEVRL